MAMTTKSILPAAQVDLLPDDQDQVHVHTGSEAEPTVVAVAGRTHFRVLDEDRMVLYRRGDHIPAEHAALPIRSAELVGGVWVPKGKQRQAPELPQRDTGAADLTTEQVTTHGPGWRGPRPS
jgi:hypothetical protein